MATPKREVKTFSFEVKRVKQLDDNPAVGIVEGFASTFGNVDRGNDIIEPGAFDKTIEEFRTSGRKIRMLFQHNAENVIGVMDPHQVRITDAGLWVVGQIALGVQRGRETHELAKLGALTDFSIGFSIDEEGFDDERRIRVIKQITLWEVSIVTEPMNPKAQILDVKAATSYKAYPIASRNREWDKASALSRVRPFLNSSESPSGTYKNAFFWYDADNADVFGSYKLPYVDVLDGALHIIPRALFAVAAVLQGGRGGVDIPDADKATIRGNVGRHYRRMDLVAPWDEDKTSDDEREDDEADKNMETPLVFKDLRDEVNVRVFEKSLRKTNLFSRSQSTALAAVFFKKGEPREEVFNFFSSSCQSDSGVSDTLAGASEIIKILGDLSNGNRETGGSGQR